jgi:hypothetical protein
MHGECLQLVLESPILCQYSDDLFVCMSGSKTFSNSQTSKMAGLRIDTLCLTLYSTNVIIINTPKHIDL